jgi:hypothetical protein
VVRRWVPAILLLVITVAPGPSDDSNVSASPARKTFASRFGRTGSTDFTFDWRASTEGLQATMLACTRLLTGRLLNALSGA